MNTGDGSCALEIVQRLVGRCLAAADNHLPVPEMTIDGRNDVDVFPVGDECRVICKSGMACDGMARPAGWSVGRLAGQFVGH